MESSQLREIQRCLPALSRDELLELAANAMVLANRSEVREKINWSEFDGILNHGPDPLEFQREIRKEWDHESRP